MSNVMDDAMVVVYCLSRMLRIHQDKGLKFVSPGYSASICSDVLCLLRGAVCSAIADFVDNVIPQATALVKQVRQSSVLHTLRIFAFFGCL